MKRNTFVGIIIPLALLSGCSGDDIPEKSYGGNSIDKMLLQSATICLLDDKSLSKVIEVMASHPDFSDNVSEVNTKNPTGGVKEFLTYTCEDWLARLESERLAKATIKE
jgi:hypothetical protein